MMTACHTWGMSVDAEAKRIVLIDGHAMAYRAFFALPAESFRNGQGQATNAVYGFARMIFNVIKLEQPTHMAVAFDLSGGSFRDRMYEEYKGGREAMPDDLRGQFALIQTMLDAFGISWYTVEDYEADDIVATIATIAEHEGVQPLLLTSDRDAIQLVSGSTTLLQPVKGVTELRRMTPAAVEEKYLVPPHLYPDLAALVGESADNLPGVPGVGPKTAAKWIGLYGDLQGILDHAEEIPGKAGQSLRDNIDAVTRNRAMNEAVRDLDLPTDFSAYSLGRGDLLAINARFDELSFGPAIRRDVPQELLSADSAPADQVIVANPELPVIHPEPGELNAVLGRHAPTGGVVFADGDWQHGRARLQRIVLSTDTASIVVDPAALSGEDRGALERWMRNSAIPKRAFSIKLTSHMLRGEDFRVRGWEFDVSLAEFLCRPDQRPTDVAGLALRHLQEDLSEARGSSAQQQLELEEEKDGRQIAEASAVRRMVPMLRDDLERHSAADLFRGMELPLAGVLERMEATGIAVDRARLDELDAQHVQQQAQVAEEAFSHIGGEQINLASPKQLQTVLFDRLGMPPTRKTKTGYSTDAESLTMLFAQTEHPFLEALLKHRDVTKLRQIIDTLRKAVTDEGRIHTTFSQNVAATGRLASANPNLQNIPARTEAGRQIRSAFTCSDGFETLLTADYSQIEMRIMAHLSEDAGLIHAFNSGEDLHSYVASQVFGVDADDVSTEMRSKTKAVSYGLAYGLSAFGLSRQLGIPQAEATTLRNQYFERFGGVRDFLHRCVEEARESGYTETILGRRRYLPDLQSDNRQRRENAERVALNSPIQGSAADIIKLAMLRVDEALRRADLTSRLLLQVHDELVLDVAPGELEQVTEIVREGMEGAYELSVPISVSPGVGRTWLEAAH